MYHIQNDQRAIRSSEMLYDGLSSLLREKPLVEISVSELVERANVGRATFYRHFDTIEDILRMRCDQVFNGFLEYVKAYRSEPPAPRTALLKLLLRYFYLHSDIIESLLLAERVDIVHEAWRILFETYKSQLTAHIGIPEEFAAYAIAVRTCALTGILVHWVENGKRHPPDELAEMLGKIMGQTVTLDQLL